jgi:hypothetical protein
MQDATNVAISTAGKFLESEEGEEVRQEKEKVEGGGVEYTSEHPLLAGPGHLLRLQ